MGTVYTLPYISGISSVSSFSSTIASLSGDNLAAYNALLNGGLYIVDGLNNYGNASASYIANPVSNEVSKVAFYLDTNRVAYWITGNRCSMNVYSRTSSLPYTSVTYYSGNTAPDGYFTYTSTNLHVDVFNSSEDAYSALFDKPITYRLTNCTAPSAPQAATAGATVSVQLQFAEGYDIVNPTSDIYVTDNGVIVPSVYSNGTLTFTMP